MLSILVSAVAIMVIEAASILLSTGMCVRRSKLKRRGAKRYKGDIGYMNGHERGGIGTRGTDKIDIGVLYASGIGGRHRDGYRSNDGVGGGTGTRTGGDLGTDRGTDGGCDDGADCGGGCGGDCGGGCGGGD